MAALNSTGSALLGSTTQASITINAIALDAGGNVYAIGSVRFVSGYARCFPNRTAAERAHPAGSGRSRRWIGRFRHQAGCRIIEDSVGDPAWGRIVRFWRKYRHRSIGQRNRQRYDRFKGVPDARAVSGRVLVPGGIRRGARFEPVQAGVLDLSWAMSDPSTPTRRSLTGRGTF